MKPFRVLTTLLFALTLLTSSFAHALCVIYHGASLRSGPGAKFPVTWVVPKYTPLVEVKRQGNWVQVEDMDGESHWVASKSVTNQMVCVSVRSSNVKVRLSPGPQGELASIRHVDKYTPFKRLDVSGTWYEVEASWGESYWVPESSVWRPMKVSKVNF